ncbi:hypothetical protein T12_13592, partial [Trichinella patagoniensis]
MYGSCQPVTSSKRNWHTLLPDYVLTPTDFHHLPSRLSQPRTKLYCNEISKQLFPEFRLNGLAVICTFILTFLLILT